MANETDRHTSTLPALSQSNAAVAEPSDDALSRVVHVHADAGRISILLHGYALHHVGYEVNR